MTAARVERILLPVYIRALRRTELPTCDSFVAPGDDAVAGTVRGARAGVTVGLVGKGTTTSNATGNFTFTDVTPPYDLYTVADGGLSVSPTRTVYYYDDLTSPTPIACASGATATSSC